MKHAKQLNEESRAYNKSEKGRAAQKLRDAIRQGKIKRQPCEICQEPDAQGHHFDYSKPLEVRWLCPKHHREEHLFEPWQNEMRRAGYTDGFELSKLIEACGEDFTSLNRYEELSIAWEARSNTGLIEGLYATPIEAVARLFLALNSDKVKSNETTKPKKEI